MILITGVLLSGFTREYLSSYFQDYFFSLSRTARLRIFNVIIPFFHQPLVLTTVCWLTVRFCDDDFLRILPALLQYPSNIKALTCDIENQRIDIAGNSQYLFYVGWLVPAIDHLRQDASN